MLENWNIFVNFSHKERVLSRFCKISSGGEICLVNLPSKPKDIKNHPALIVSLDIRNKLANDIIVVPLSTTLRSSPTHVLLPEGEGGLSKSSMAKCEQVTTMDKSLLIKGPFAGKISNEKRKYPESFIGKRAIEHWEKGCPVHEAYKEIFGGKEAESKKETK